MAIQLWNELVPWVQIPLGTAEGLPFEERGYHHAEKLRTAHLQIKAANPDVLVGTEGTADHPARRGYSAFLRGMLESDPLLDVLAVHVHGPWSKKRRIVAEAREIVGENPVWITEFGYDQDKGRGPVDLDRHLANWRTAIEGTSGSGWWSANTGAPYRRIHGPGSRSTAHSIPTARPSARPTIGFGIAAAKLGQERKICGTAA